MISIKQIFSVVVLAATVAACTDPESSGSVQIESAKQSKSLSIEKYQLKNGLDVVLHQDKSDPVVAVAIVYHVGSNRELL
ncbi:hypothetical protein [Psychrosphaera algicola]|uniref:Uncharacterized protein n=1 Tax=Psychrosphaera algicola TaxID=3023714 RepID=A0ABT5FF25_9GAMM|nr:hypothetical protein [Psychrosphaera sp. G1-22]MDC2889644.1 hypothetical protein [Psychrosphaera sp. G1-22]